MTQTSTMPAPAVAADIAAVRRRSPLVHCLTNAVAKAFTANVLLAAGAGPAMIEDAGEADEFARVADALLVNVGTVTEQQAAAIRSAVAAARQAGTGWVLDPVAVGGLTLRTRLARELLDLGPTVVRGNASEVLTLAAGGAGGRGVDSTAGSDEALGAAADLAAASGTVVAVSGETDYVTDGTTVYAVPGGHRWLTTVSGSGCALGALVAAGTAVAGSPVAGAVAGCTLMARAAELAAVEARGPGSFAVALLDALHRVDDATLRGAP